MATCQIKWRLFHALDHQGKKSRLLWYLHSTAFPIYKLCSEAVHTSPPIILLLLSHQLHHPSKTPINIVFIITPSTLPFSKRSTIKGRINHYPTPVCLLASQSKTNSLLDTRIWVYRKKNRHLAVPASPLEAIKNEICGIRCRCRDIIKALVVAASDGW